MFQTVNYENYVLKLLMQETLCSYYDVCSEKNHLSTLMNAK